MHPRLNVFQHARDIYKAMTGVEAAMRDSSLPHTTYALVKLRVSQTNGCGFCVDMHARDLKAEGESDERLWALATWREAPYFTDAERAALDLAEAATRIADNPHGVPDSVWDAAAKEYDEQTLAALVMAVATINFWNRVGVTTRAVAGSHVR